MQAGDLGIWSTSPVPGDAASRSIVKVLRVTRTQVIVQQVGTLSNQPFGEEMRFRHPPADGVGERIQKQERWTERTWIHPAYLPVIVELRVQAKGRLMRRQCEDARWQDMPLELVEKIYGMLLPTEYLKK